MPLKCDWNGKIGFIIAQFIGNTIILYYTDYTIELRLCVRKNAEEIFICSCVNIVIQIILDLNSSTALQVAINQAPSADESILETSPNTMCKP